MILEFKTARNKTNGSRRYLAIDTGAETYSTFCPFMVTPGIEIKYSDYKAMIEKLEKLEYHRSEQRIFLRG